MKKIILNTYITLSTMFIFYISYCYIDIVLNNLSHNPSYHLNLIVYLFTKFN